VSRLQRTLRDRSRVELLLVDWAQSFLFTPMLLPMLAGLERVDRAALPWARVVDTHRVQLLKDELLAVETAQQRVFLERMGWLNYDALILALGSARAPGALPGVRTFEEGLELKARLIRRPEALSVIGGGPVGCELAGVLCELSPGPRTTLYEAGPQLLAGMGDTARPMAFDAQTELTSKGVSLRLGVRVDERPDGVWAGDDALEPAVTIDCRAGKPPLLEGLPTTAAGRIPVNRQLRLEGGGEVYVGGDCAQVDGEPELRRGIARAVSHGQTIAENVHAGLTGRARIGLKDASPSFVLRLGNERAVGLARGVSVSGSAAWTLRQSVMVSQSPALNQKLTLATEAGLQAAKQSVSWFLGKLKR